MSWSKRIRQIHRWLSIVFTVTVVANIAVNVAGMGDENVAILVGLSALIPLALLLISGLYLFALPYTAHRRSSLESAPEE